MMMIWRQISRNILAVSKHHNDIEASQNIAVPLFCLAEHGVLEQTHNVLQLPIKLAVFHTDSEQQL